MKRINYLLPIFVLMVCLTASSFFPYPLFSHNINLTNSQSHEINLQKETELKNIHANTAKTINISWENGIDSLLSLYTPIEIINLETEETFYVMRIGGKNHADVIPVSREDENMINQRKSEIPIAIKYNDISLIPACFCTYPHGYQNHYCIHFKNTKTDGTNKVEQTYQKVVKKAKVLSNQLIKK